MKPTGDFEWVSHPINYKIGVRNRQVFDLLSLLQSSQIIALLGEGGTGKSTLVHSGLFSELSKGFMGIGGKNWKFSTFRPGITPIENLSAGFSQFTDPAKKEKLEEDFLLSKKIRSSSEGLKNASIQFLDKNNGNNYLLVIDNFEDLFHLKSGNDNRETWNLEVSAFIQNLSKCSTNSDVPLYFLIILRSDFVPHLFEFRRFYEKLSKSQYSIPLFRKSEFDEMVYQNFKINNIPVSNDVVEQINNNFSKDLKDLLPLKFFFQKTIYHFDENQKSDINQTNLINSTTESLYLEKLESFFEKCSSIEKVILEKTLKQLTITSEGSARYNPIKLHHLSTISGIDKKLIIDLIFKIQKELDFVMDCHSPFQERIPSDPNSFIADESLIALKNEYFVNFWPRLLQWIKEEKESQEIYMRLSESAILFDKDLTGYLRSPDLDFAIQWYENQKPDESWAKQFNENYKKTTDYLLKSKINLEKEILAKEETQRQKLRTLRKQISYVVLSFIVVFIVIAVFAYDAKQQESIANQAREKAEREQKRAKIEKERADILYVQTQEAMTIAQTNEQMALMEKTRADNEFKKADQLRIQAEDQKIKIQSAYKELGVKSDQLVRVVDDLKVSNDLKTAATREAQSARDYQENLNKILSLRNKIQQKEYLKDDILKILDDVNDAYQSYNTASLAFKGIVLPNNDLFQVLLSLKNDLQDLQMLKTIPLNIASQQNGLRKIIVSSTQRMATGGDDGVLLFSKAAMGQTIPDIKKVKLNNDRIRSLAFIDDRNLIFGTVKGFLYTFNTDSEVLLQIPLSEKSPEIIEQIIWNKYGVFVLRGKKLWKINVLENYSAELIPNLSVKNIFSYQDDKLVFTDEENNLSLMETASLKTQVISTDFPNKLISAFIPTKDYMFLGTHDGNVIICKPFSMGRTISLKTLHRIPAHVTRITSLAYDENSKKLFTASLDQKASIYQLNLLDLGMDYVLTHHLKIEGFNKWIWDFKLIGEANNKKILTVDENGDLKLWQIGSESLYQEIFKTLGTAKNRQIYN